ncbi:MAG: cobalamin biosynthesis protein CobD [Deltaproteobacteria bacterium]|nr:cobalamin biosynthesis protein CobD [Deltaproteobacteria bacterium]
MDTGLLSTSAYILVAAFVLDALLGDPSWCPHPVRWMGAAITSLERVFRRETFTPQGEYASGAVISAIVVCSTYLVSFFLLYLSYGYSKSLFYGLSVYMVWMSLSLKSLKDAGEGVIAASKSRGPGAARVKLSHIVGRDTDGLDEPAVLRATVETVAENTSDGVVAPLFYFAVGGPSLMLAYKAVNTLDSMLGYKNARYINFGRFPAKLDDAANYIPARLTAALMVAASFIMGLDWRRAFTVWMRDGRAHSSPNSGNPEAAASGALNVRLGGGSTYGGVMFEKPCIGGEFSEPTETAVVKGIGMMTITAVFMLLLTLGFRATVLFLW